MLSINSVEGKKVIKKLTHHFLQGSLKFELDLEEIYILTPDVQEVFLDLTIHHERVKKFPLNNGFYIIFFKKLISYLERNQEIHDDIYIFLCSVMKKPHESDGFCYRHYVLKNNVNCLVTIKETKNMVVHGTTGLKTWEAAFMLSDWAICNKDLIDNKKVLELGSGVGFTGVMIAKYCNAQTIILTDCHEEVLSTIKDNIKINFPNILEEGTPYITKFTDNEKSIGVTMLDWNDVEELPHNIVPDIIIGADIVYDPSILPILCNTIINFFKRNSNLEVYIASVIRNELTFGKFLETLDDLGLKFEEIVQLQPVYIDWDQEIKRKTIKIKYGKH